MRFGRGFPRYTGFRTSIAARKAPSRALLLLAVLAAGTARAQLPMPASTQFDVTGYIEEAILDPTCAADPHCGGTIKVQGHVVVVPKEIVVMFPANALTWQELFAQAPLPYGLTAVGGPSSGMAAADVPAPLTNYLARVVGNRVVGGPAGPDLYIAALLFVSQDSLAGGAGFISFIDYALGEMRVGGILNDPGCAQGGTALTNPLCTGARVRIDDPAGRYGRANSPDVRFTVDADNPTIAAGTGFPICLPRTDPAVADDPLCPQAQRPVVAGVFQTSIQTNDPTNPGLVGVPPDATKQVPFEVGDYVTFHGTVVTDNVAAPTQGPWPGFVNTYVSAHTIINNVAIYTWPGTNPAYVLTDTALMGTGGLTVLGATEAVARTRFEGMTTDPSRIVHLYGIDTNPTTGTTVDRDWGTIGVDPGPPTGAVKGRWRFRPPCAPSGTLPSSKQCTMNSSGTFLPPPREMRAVIQGAWTPPAAGTVSPTAANGLVYGQYHAPIFEYIFPENVPATPIVANNFNSIDFLVQGGYTTAGGTLVKQLNPWPDSTIPIVTCVVPTANAGGPYFIQTGGTITLAGSGSGSAPLGFSWTVSSGTLSNPAIANPVFSTSGAISPVTATLSVGNGCGTATAVATIAIGPSGKPTVNPIPPITVFAGAAGSILLSGSDPNVPAQSLTFSVTQTGTPALVKLTTRATGPTTATVTFTAPALPVGATSSVVNLSVIATNTGNANSAPALTTVTIKPAPDVVAITAAQYRTSRVRLDLTATSTVVSPNVVLKLQPYLTVTGATFDPTALGNTFTNTGGGICTLTLVGAPEPPFRRRRRSWSAPAWEE